MVSMRLRVSGPVSSILPSANECKHAPRAIFFAKLRILGIVRVLGLFFCVEVIEVAVEFIESMIGRQHLIAVAQVILAELSRRIAKRFEQPGNRRIFYLHAQCCTGQTDFCQTGPHSMLTHDERSATGGAALLRVVIGEHHPFAGDAIDIGSLIPHHAMGVGADIGRPTSSPQMITMLGRFCSWAFAVMEQAAVTTIAATQHITRNRNALMLKFFPFDQGCR